VFVELERVIGAIWLPIIALTVIDYFVNGTMLTVRAAAMDTGDTSQLAPLLVGQFVYIFVALLLKAIIAVAICREILSPLQRPQWLRFSLGGAEFRFVGTTLALAALATLIAVLCMIVGKMLVPAGGTQQMIAMTALIGIVLAPGLIYLFVRLGALALPAVVLEGGIGLEQSWALLKGNVGRMLIVLLALVVPVAIVYLLLYGLIMGPEAFSPRFDMLVDAAARRHYEVEIVRLTAARLPWLEGLNFVLAPVLYGLWFAAPAFVYKALTAK
jgi:hypothetical protein